MELANLRLKTVTELVELFPPNLDDTERQFSLSAAQYQIIEYMRRYQRLDSFDLFKDEETRAHYKNMSKLSKDEIKNKKAGLNTHLYGNINGMQYFVWAKLSGSIVELANGILYKDIEQFLNQSRLSYLKIVKCPIIGMNPEIIIEVGKS